MQITTTQLQTDHSVLINALNGKRKQQRVGWISAAPSTKVAVPFRLWRMALSLIRPTNQLRNAHEINWATSEGFMFVFKAQQQAHSWLRNCCCNEEDEHKDKLVVEVISCTFLCLIGIISLMLNSFPQFGPLFTQRII